MSMPFPIFGEANNHDDDGQVIDSLFIETDAPPDLHAAVEPIPIISLHDRPRYDRLDTNTVIFAVGGAPQQILAPDKNRTHLRIDVRSYSGSVVVNDYIVIADEFSKCSSQVMSQGTARIRPGFNASGGYNIDDYTGALWAAPGANVSGIIEITYTAVTS